ncbi:MAG: SPFH domain-containing protein [Acetobacter sp.]|nr:SPFH domain-containing protein [Acetobacter sp.]
MPGYVGYQIVLGKMMKNPVQAGLQFVWPFISSVTEVDVRLQKHEDSNVMKTANLRDITLSYALTYQIDKAQVAQLHATIGEDNYVVKALCPWLDAVMTQVVASKTYEDINGKLGDLSTEIEAAYLAKVENQCNNIAGRNLFVNMSVAITDVKFDDEYTKAISDLAKTQKYKEIVEAKAEQMQIIAEAEAKAALTKAQAEADALKLKGASENEIKERLGEILKSHPELLKETLAKNFPKVFGGNSIVNLDDLLGK